MNIINEIEEIQIYVPDLTEICIPDSNEIKIDYYQLWRGLPKLDMEEVKSRGGYLSLKYEKKRIYIWVPHDALEIYQREPNSIFAALTDKITHNIVWIFPESSDHSLDEIIEKTKKLNKNLLMRSLKEQKNNLMK